MDTVQNMCRLLPYLLSLWLSVASVHAVRYMDLAEVDDLDSETSDDLDYDEILNVQNSTGTSKQNWTGTSMQEDKSRSEKASYVTSASTEGLPTSQIALEEHNRNQTEQGHTAKMSRNRQLALQEQVQDRLEHMHTSKLPGSSSEKEQSWRNASNEGMSTSHVASQEQVEDQSEFTHPSKMPGSITEEEQFEDQSEQTHPSKMPESSAEKEQSGTNASMKSLSTSQDELQEQIEDQSKQLHPSTLPGSSVESDIFNLLSAPTYKLKYRELVAEGPMYFWNHPNWILIVLVFLPISCLVPIVVMGIWDSKRLCRIFRERQLRDSRDSP